MAITSAMQKMTVYCTRIVRSGILEDEGKHCF